MVELKINQQNEREKMARKPINDKNRILED